MSKNQNFCDFESLASQAKERTRIRGISSNCLADTIVGLMNDKKITVEQLAESSHVSDKTIQRIRNELNYKPGLQTMISLCIALELEPTLSKYLIGLSGYTLRNTDEGNAYDIVLHSYAVYGVYECNELLKANGYKPIIHVRAGKKGK